MNRAMSQRGDLVENSIGIAAVSQEKTDFERGMKLRTGHFNHNGLEQGNTGKSEHEASQESDCSGTGWAGFPFSHTGILIQE